MEKGTGSFLSILACTASCNPSIKKELVPFSPFCGAVILPLGLSEYEKTSDAKG
jgi:hypothetical protein